MRRVVPKEPFPNLGLGRQAQLQCFWPVIIEGVASHVAPEDEVHTAASSPHVDGSTLGPAECI